MLALSAWNDVSQSVNSTFKAMINVVEKALFTHAKRPERTSAVLIFWQAVQPMAPERKVIAMLH